MTLPPGSTLGVLGGGQLGKMIGLEARRMGYRFAVTDPDPECSARRVSDHYFEGAFSDRDAAFELSKVADVITVETEHVPAELLAEVEKLKPLFPGSLVLHVVQDRLRQKEFLERNGFPAPAFRAVSDGESLARAVEEVGAPCLLKTRRGGYDGKGQARIFEASEAVGAWEGVGKLPVICEAFVDFRMEVSVVLARDAQGNVAYYPVAENVHRRGVLHTTRAPARIPESVAERARGIAAGVAAALDHVGVMAVEMFVTRDDRVLVNEIAPRVHNSGHFTFGACATSQFEQHLRAVCGLPLGDTTLLAPAAMLNLLGDVWAKGEPDWNVVFRHPTASLHLYGKRDARPGRKMGHVTVVHRDADEAMRVAEEIHEEMSARAGIPSA